MEQTNPEFLATNRDFYELARDATNFLATINASANFIIYLVFGQEFRLELLEMFQKK